MHRGSDTGVEVSRHTATHKDKGKQEASVKTIVQDTKDKEVETHRHTDMLTCVYRVRDEKRTQGQRPTSIWKQTLH